VMPNVITLDRIKITTLARISRCTADLPSEPLIIYGRPTIGAMTLSNLKH
jgi:hypothetical protein